MAILGGRFLGACALLLCSLITSEAAQTATVAVTSELVCLQLRGTGAASQPDAGSGIYDMLRGATAATIDNQVGDMIARLKAQNVDPSLIVDTLIAAYCPLIAADTGLTAAQKRARIDTFSQQVTGLVFAGAQQQVSDIIITLPLAPDVLQKVDAAARAAQVSRDAWLKQAIQNGLPAGK